MDGELAAGQQGTGHERVPAVRGQGRSGGVNAMRALTLTFVLLAAVYYAVIAYAAYLVVATMP